MTRGENEPAWLRGGEGRGREGSVTPRWEPSPHLKGLNSIQPRCVPSHLTSCRFCAAGAWRRSASTAAWAVWRSLMSASPGRSRCPAGVTLRRWSSRWGRRRGSCSRTGQPSPAPLSFKPSWDQPPSSRCSSTSASCRDGCPLEEVSRAQTRHKRKALLSSSLVLFWPMTSVLHLAASVVKPELQTSPAPPPSDCRPDNGAFRHAKRKCTACKSTQFKRHDR